MRNFSPVFLVLRYDFKEKTKILLNFKMTTIESVLGAWKSDCNKHFFLKIEFFIAIFLIEDQK